MFLLLDFFLGSKQSDMAQDAPEMALYLLRTAQIAPQVAQDDPMMAPRCVNLVHVGPRCL